jgi:hypothetical protein
MPPLVRTGRERQIPQFVALYSHNQAALHEDERTTRGYDCCVKRKGILASLSVSSLAEQLVLAIFSFSLIESWSHRLQMGHCRCLLTGHQPPRSSGTLKRGTVQRYLKDSRSSYSTNELQSSQESPNLIGGELGEEELGDFLKRSNRFEPTTPTKLTGGIRMIVCDYIPGSHVDFAISRTAFSQAASSFNLHPATLPTLQYFCGSFCRFVTYDKDQPTKIKTISIIMNVPRHWRLQFMVSR